MFGPTSPLKDRLRADLTTSIKARDKVRSGTIRMVLTAISEAEVAGAESIELSDQQVLDVVIREAKKRREAEEAYAAAGRSELAENPADRPCCYTCHSCAGRVSALLPGHRQTGAAGGLKCICRDGHLTPQPWKADGAAVAEAPPARLRSAWVSPQRSSR